MFVSRKSYKPIISTLQRCTATEASAISKKEEYYKNLALQGTEESPKDWDKALPFDQIPKTPHIPILGSLYKFLPGAEYYGKHILEYNQDMRKKLGDIYVLKSAFGRDDIVECCNPNDFETLLRNEGAWPIRRGNECFAYYRNVTRKDIFQGVGGVLTTEGKEWFDFRSKVNPILMQPKVTKKYIRSMDLVANDLLDNIRHFSRINNEMPENFVQELNKWALESIAVVALDKRLGCLNLNLDKNSPVLQYISTLNQLPALMFYLDALPIYKYFPTRAWRKFVKLMDNVTFSNLKLIEEAEERLKQKTDSDTEPSVLEKLIKIDKKVAVVMAMDMLMAGVDTTSKTLGAALYFLAKNPDKQAKLREEIREKLPEKNSPVTTEILEKSRYLKAVIKETTRIVPIGAAMLRNTTKNIVLGGYQIPKGTDVVILLLLESMNGSSHFKRPKEFIPERWLKSMEGNELYHKNAHPFVSLPFGFGPRSCIGKRLANLELEVSLSKIIRNFELEWKHEDMKFGGTLLYGIEDPLRLTIKEISN